MLLKSLNYWSAPGGLEHTLDPVEFLKLAKTHGFAAAELAIGKDQGLHLHSTRTQCEDIRATADELGLLLPSVASGLFWEHALGDAVPASRKMAAQQLEQMIQITGWLGAKTLLFIPGSVDVFFMPSRPPQPYEEVLTHAIEGIQAALPSAQQNRVRLGIENVWNKFLQSPLEMRQFVDQFDSPWIGAYVDVGNVLLTGYPEDWLRTLRHRVVGIHFKDFRTTVGTVEGFVDLLEGDVNWPEVMRAIREIGYEGPVVAEMIPCYRHHAEVRIANTSRAIDAILA